MKIARHAEIMKLIEQYQIGTQEELVEKLNERGFKATQATVSRDIRQLRLTKVPTDSGRVKYAVSSHGSVEKTDRLMRVLKEAVVSMEPAGTILVVKTAIGMGMAAATALDDALGDQIVGTIAGDDTVFCATKSVEAAEELAVILENRIRE